MSNRYVLGDSIKSISTDEYHYFFSGTPCYEDLSSFGVDVNEPESYKTKFLDWFVPSIQAKNGTVTIAFTGCRRNNARILPKFYYLNQAFYENNYYLRDVKYYIKKQGFDGYSHTIGHVYSFQKNDIKGHYNLRKNKLYKTYGLDIWGPFNKEIVIDGEVVAQPPQVPSYCIRNFTEIGETVYDPFGGIGSTGLAAHRLNRKFFVYEKREPIYEYGFCQLKEQGIL